MASLQETLGNAQWLIDNYPKLRELFPTARTQADLEFLTRLGFRLKVVGVDWRSNDELLQVMLLCHHLGLYDQWRSGDALWVARSANTQLPVSFFNLSPEQVLVRELLRTEPDAETVAASKEALAKFRLPSAG